MVRKRNGFKVIQKFLNEAKKEISIEKVIVFGSYAKGKAKRDSDIDIAIISRDFNRLKPIERLTLLGKIAWRAHTTQIEALGYTPEEYRVATRFDFLGEIKQKGKFLLV
jgi:predicted nucleotidyltransferase